MYIFVLDIYCQQLGNICQLNLYIGIGYILPTIADICQLEGVSAPFDAGLVNVYLHLYFTLLYYNIVKRDFSLL